MKWTRKEHSIKVSRTEGRSKGKLHQNFTVDNFQNLLIKLTSKASGEKAWVIYEFLFSLNPGGKLNNAHTWKNYPSLYPKSQFQANSKKKWWDILEAAK